VTQQVLYSLKVYEEPYAVSEQAREDWRERLAGAKTKICRGIAQAFGVQVAEGQDPCAAIAAIPQDQFIRKLAEPAVSGWRDFFGVQEGTRAYLASVKMQAKLATAAPLYGERLSNAMLQYFADRVSQSVDKWVARMVTIRFVGDPPHTSYGPAPYLALRITGEHKAASYRPPHAQESGTVDNYLTAWARMYARPAIIATLVQYSVFARYLLDAGLEEQAGAVLEQLATVMNDVLTRLKRDDVNIQFAAGYEQVDFMETPAIYYIVTVTPAAQGG